MTAPRKEQGATPSKHSSSDVWNRLGSLEQDFSGFKGEVKADIASLKIAVTTAVEELKVVAKGKSTNWGWIAAGLTFCLYVFQSFLSPTNDSLKDLKVEATASHRERVAAAYERGREAERNAVQTSRLEKMEGFLEEIRRTRFTNIQGEEVLSRLRALEDEDYSRPEAERDLDKLETRFLELAAQVHEHQKDGHPGSVKDLQNLIRQYLEKEMEWLRSELLKKS